MSGLGFSRFNGNNAAVSRLTMIDGGHLSIPNVATPNLKY